MFKKILSHKKSILGVVGATLAIVGVVIARKKFFAPIEIELDETEKYN